MAKRKDSENPAATEVKTAPAGAEAAEQFAQSQRDNAPEESADDIARKALTGEDKNNGAESVSTDTPAPTEEKPPAPGVRDKSGELFNPELHAVNREGAPSFAKSGLFRRKRGLGARVNVPTVPTVAADPAIAARLAAEAEEAKQRKALMAGTAVAEIIFKSGYMLGGDEWLPIKDDSRQIDERRDMISCWQAYCYARGMDDIPPGMLVAFVVSAYALPRFSGTETQKRVGKAASMFKRLGLWFQDWRIRRAARASNRNDGERKDDARKGDSESANRQ